MLIGLTVFRLQFDFLEQIFTEALHCKGVLVRLRVSRGVKAMLYSYPGLLFGLLASAAWPRADGALAVCVCVCVCVRVCVCVCARVCMCAPIPGSELIDRA